MSRRRWAALGCGLLLLAGTVRPGRAAPAVQDVTPAAAGPTTAAPAETLDAAGGNPVTVPNPAAGEPAETPAPAAGDPAATWDETATRHFVILSQPASVPARDYFATRADALYEALAAVFGAELETPITLRLFGSIEAYRGANPLAAEIDGALEPGRRGRRELDLAVPAAMGDAGASPDGSPHAGLDDALRRELAYRFAARLSGERLPAGLRAGIAQYLELPDARNAAGVARLREALDEGRLYNWSELYAPGGAFVDPPLTLPQNLSIVHYLAGTFGFAKLADLVRASAGAPGWRDALESTYGRPPVELEAAWRAWLPSYLDGGWRRHALYSQDLGLAEAMLAQGDYAGATRQLGGVLSLLASADPPAAAPARALLARAESGLAARRSLDAAGAALAAGDYPAAEVAALEARRALTGLGDGRGADQAGTIAERARLGAAAARSLARTERLPPWRLIEARHAAYQAAVGFAQVGNDVAAARARAKLTALDRRLAPAGWALLLVGIALLAWNVRRRLRDRASRPWERGPPARTSSRVTVDARRAGAGQGPALPG